MKHSDERRQNLIQLLRTSKKLTIEQTMKALDVSDSTVRRLFTHLESDGLAVRTYGGICYNDAGPDGNTYSFELTQLRNPEEKARIGSAALKFIKSGDIVFLDSGTTVTSLCSELDRMFTETGDLSSYGYANLKQKYNNVTIFTNSFANLNILKKHMKVYLIGGEYREARRDFCGYLTEEVVKNLRFTKCFVGADGYSLGAGVLASDFDTARINQLVVQNSVYSILVADSTKYGRNAVARYATISAINCIISDSGLPNDVCSQIHEYGIDLITT